MTAVKLALSAALVLVLAPLVLLGMALLPLLDLRPVEDAL
jgi:hypothetical protein